MDTFIFAANAVLPVILMTALGYFLKRVGLADAGFVRTANKLCFRCFLPVMLFVNLYDGGGVHAGDLPVVGFCAAALGVMFALGMIIVRLVVPEAKQKGVVLQCVFRSNFAIIGLPLARSLAGDEGARLAAVASVAVIPLFNALAVVALTMYRRDASGKKTGIGKTVRGVITNPLIIGVCCALLVLGGESLLAGGGVSWRLSDLTPLYSAMKSIAGITSPLALGALGAQFEFSAVKALARPIAVGTLSRLALMPLLTIGAASLLFDLDPAKCALLVAMTASPVAVSSMVMATEMDGDGTLAGQLVVWTTVLSMISLFGIVAALRALALF